MILVIIGSEGTLGIITKITVRLIPKPQAIMTLLGVYPDITSATESISMIIKSHIIPATLEFMDRACVFLIRGQIPIRLLPETQALLIIEVDGEPNVLEKQVEEIGEVCFEEGALDMLVADSSHKRQGLWDVRRKMVEIIKEAKAYKRGEDVVVPTNRITDLVEGAYRIGTKHGFDVYNFGHLGDGNVHVNLTHDQNTPEIRDRGAQAAREIFALALEYGGSISGEHGIGTIKQAYIEMELCPESIRLQKAIKVIFDPHNIMNPGKIFPY